jgi:hypothetical protein
MRSTDAWHTTVQETEGTVNPRKRKTGGGVLGQCTCVCEVKRGALCLSDVCSKRSNMDTPPGLGLYKSRQSEKHGGFHGPLETTEPK